MGLALAASAAAAAVQAATMANAETGRPPGLAQRRHLIVLACMHRVCIMHVHAMSLLNFLIKEYSLYSLIKKFRKT